MIQLLFDSELYGFDLYMMDTTYSFDIQYPTDGWYNTFFSPVEHFKMFGQTSVIILEIV